MKTLFRHNFGFKVERIFNIWKTFNKAGKLYVSNSHFEKISLWLIVQHVENICKGSRRLFLLRCNQYFFHRSLNAPTPVELCLRPGLPDIARRSGEAGGRERRSLQLRLTSGAVW